MGNLKTMNIKQYKDKVHGCWLGKNIGGTLGAPFECIRGTFDLDFYTQDLSQGTPPNDDLDLQLLWLNAAERYGKQVNSQILGDYWLSYIVASFSEYGAGKNNLAQGLLPPLSGWYNNHNRDSCGAFIRSEIWACLAPGHPEIAVKYAYEDASVDHFNEGIYGEIFTAAVESAAFVESDTDALIDIGLSYIPKDCGVALAINTVRKCYRTNLDWKQARKKVLQTTPCSFGMYVGYQDRPVEDDIPVGESGYDAPANVGIMVLGWLYGEGDIGKSICIAAGCCEDGDCTAATLGSILGIINGASNLPEKWISPLGDTIKCICLNSTDSTISIPRTLTELSARVCALMPIFMGPFCDTMNDDGVSISLLDTKDLYCTSQKIAAFSSINFKDRFNRPNPSVSFENTFLHVMLNYESGIDIKENVPVIFNLDFFNLAKLQQWLNVKIIMPEDWTCSTSREFSINLDQLHGGYGYEVAQLSITPTNITKSKYTVVLEISSNARLSKLYIPITLISTPQSFRHIKH